MWLGRGETCSLQAGTFGGWIDFLRFTLVSTASVYIYANF